MPVPRQLDTVAVIGNGIIGHGVAQVFAMAGRRVRLIGRSEASLGQRCAAFRARTDELADRHQVAVITHWGFIRALTGQEVTNATLVRLD